MEIDYGVDPMFKYFDPNLYISWTGEYYVKSVTKEDIEAAVMQKYQNADPRATSYAVGEGISQAVYYLQVLSVLTSACSMSGAGASGTPSGEMMIAGTGGEVYIADGMMSMPLYMGSGSTYTFFEESNKSKTEEETGIQDWENYYKKGRPEGGNPKIDELLRKDKAKIKSNDFKEFLEEKGENPNKWIKVMETWETPDGDIYERHYWTDGTNSYYHE